MKQYQGKINTISDAKTVPHSQTTEYRQNYYQKNREKLIAASRAWQEENKDHVKQQKKAWYQKNGHTVKARMAQNRRARTAQGLNTRTGEPLPSILGRIYLMQVGQGNPYKIGYTSEPINIKKSKVQMHHWTPVEVVYLSGDVQGVNFLETLLHEKFADKCVSGEWYDLNKTNVKNIKTMVNKLVNTTVTAGTKI